MSSFETLLTPSGVQLYGRLLYDVLINKDLGSYNASGQTPLRGGQGGMLLQKQLEDPSAQLARIYGFAYGGKYYELDDPPIFLVHGEGLDPEFPRPFDPNNAGLASLPADVDRGGIAKTGDNYAPGIRVWAYDKMDYLIRFDLSAGALTDILLLPELTDEEPPAYGRVGGAKVGGAKVGAAKVGGAKVGGAKVGGV